MKNDRQRLIIMQSLHDVLHLDSRVGAALGMPVLRGRKPVPFSPNAAIDCSCKSEEEEMSAHHHAG